MRKITINATAEVGWFQEFAHYENEILAIVELKDGSISKVPISGVQFLDSPDKERLEKITGIIANGIYSSAYGELSTADLPLNAIITAKKIIKLIDE